MAQAGFTPVQLYHSTTAAATPSAGNLANGELAINITDGKLYYKDNGGTVRVLAGTGGTGVVAGSNTQVQFNNNGVFGASSGLTWDGTNLTASQLRSSGLTSGRVTYASTSGLLVDSANMTFNGTRLTVADFADASLTSGRVTYAGAGGNLTDSANLTFDGTNLTLGGGTANGVAYLNGSKVLTTGSALTFDGTRFTVKGGNANSLWVDNGGQRYTELDFANNGVVKSSIYWDNTSADLFYSSTGSATFGAASYYAWNIGSEQMRLTSTGLGIGTSSPAARLDLNASGSNAQMAVQNWPMMRVVGTTLDIGGYNASQWTQTRLYTNGNIAATLDSSGNLGLGVTPTAASGFAANKFLEMGGASAPALVFRPSGSTCEHTVLGAGDGLVLGATGAATASNNTIRFFTSNTNSSTTPTERARIDSSGNFFLGTTGQIRSGDRMAVAGTGTTVATFQQNTNTSGYHGIAVNLQANGNNTSTYAFWGNTSGVGNWYLYGNGTTSYSSDARLKKNIATTRDGYLDDVMKLRVVKYNWNKDDDSTPKELGLIAQEVEQVFPGLVQDDINPVEDGGEIYKQVKQSVIPFILLKALQELKAEFDAYKATHP